MAASLLFRTQTCKQNPPRRELTKPNGHNPLDRNRRHKTLRTIEKPMESLDIQRAATLSSDAIGRKPYKTNEILQRSQLDHT